jgi:uncharacterized protein YuzE
MYVSYDPDARATYVKWETSGKIARTVEIGDSMMVDVDEHDRPLGVEFLMLPNQITAKMLERLADEYPDLKKLRDTDRWMLTPA